MAIEKDEIDRIVEIHGPAVWRTISRLLGSQQEAADCFQETFLEFIRANHRQRINRPIALLRTIATRRAIDCIRRNSSERNRFSPLNDQHESGSPNPLSSAAGSELADWLSSALREIDPLEAAIFCMMQLDGMDRGEVAAVMGITTNHVSVLLHRARIKLQKMLSEKTSLFQR